MRHAVRLISWLALLAAAGLGVLYLLPPWQLLGETVLITASLIPYGLPLAAAALALLALVGSRRPALALACVVLLMHLLIARPYWRGDVPAPPSDLITVMTMNMRCNTPGDEELARLLRESNPDVAVVNGLGRRSRSMLIEALADQYTTAAFSPMPGNPVCGTVVFTDLPFDGWVATQQQPTALMRAPGFEFALVAVDIPTPTDGITPWVGSFDEFIEDVAGLTDRPVVAVGDFNAVLEHEPMRRLTAETGLRDAVVGSGLGWMPTFPGDGMVPPVVALDHVMVSPGLVASSAWTESVSGQAHRALLVTVGITE
ncbi:endonuclease/exonuclease/phosphatase family protein [Tessaracoccus sp. Y1736]